MDQDAPPHPPPPFVARLAAADAMLTDAEHAAYRTQSRHMARSLVPAPGGWGLWVGGGVLALAGALAALLLGVVRERGGGTVAVLLMAAYLAGMFAAMRYQRRYERRLYRAQRKAVAATHGARHYTLDEDGVSFGSDASVGRMPWRVFDQVVVAGGVLLLRADRMAQLVAIPARAFASPDEAARAADYATAKVDAPLPGRGRGG